MLTLDSKHAKFIASLVKTVIPRRPPVPVLSYFAVDPVPGESRARVSGTDLETWFAVDVDGTVDVPFLVDAATFTKAVASTRKQPVVLAPGAVVTGGARLMFPPFEREQYPAVPQPGGLLGESDLGDARALAEAWERVAHAVRGGDPGPFGCVLFEGDGETAWLVATDTHRLAAARFAGSPPSGERLVLPLAFFRAAALVSPLAAGSRWHARLFTSNWGRYLAVSADHPGGVRATLVVTPAEHKWPRWRNVFAQSCEQPVIGTFVASDALLAAARQAARLAPGRCWRDNTGVVVAAGAGYVRLQARNRGAVVYDATVEAKAKGDGRTGLFLNSDYFVDALAVLRGRCVDLHAEGAGLSTCDNDLLYLLLPIEIDGELTITLPEREEVS